MARAMILSKTATLAIVLVAIAACVSFSSAIRAQVPAPMDKPTLCQTKADCETTKCHLIGHKATCYNGVCTCQDDVRDYPVKNNKTCSTIKDCKSTHCSPQPGWHVQCDDGKCKCVFDVPPQY